MTFSTCSLIKFQLFTVNMEKVVTARINAELTVKLSTLCTVDYLEQ